MNADHLITRLGLTPHPEGGWFRQTWVADTAAGIRPAGASILFLMQADERSHWHRFDADEVWFHQQGAPVLLRMAPDADGPVTHVTLGPDQPQAHVPSSWWQTARPVGGWALVGCATAPAFQFEGFELAAPGFDIPG